MRDRIGMSRVCSIIFLIFLFLAETSPAAPSVSVLFVGNSLTQANDLPAVFKQFAAGTSSHLEIATRAITTGGALFYDHWKKGEAVAVLREQRPNFLILQGQSTEPLVTPQNFAYYARMLKAEADRVSATTVLLSTWARPVGDPYYKNPTSGGAPAEMQTRVSAAYASLARDLGAILAPVGVAFERAHLNAPNIALLDGTQHPSRAGTYLAAAMLFRALFRISSVSSTYSDGLPKETAVTLQQVANEIPLVPAP